MKFLAKYLIITSIFTTHVFANHDIESDQDLTKLDEVEEGIISIVKFSEKSSFISIPISEHESKFHYISDRLEKEKQNKIEVRMLSWISKRFTEKELRNFDNLPGPTTFKKLFKSKKFTSTEIKLIYKIFKGNQFVGLEASPFWSSDYSRKRKSRQKTQFSKNSQLRLIPYTEEEMNFKYSPNRAHFEEINRMQAAILRSLKTMLTNQDLERLSTLSGEACFHYLI